MKKGSTEYDVYAILLEWPDNNLLKLGAPISSFGTTVTMQGYSGKISWTPAPDNKGINVQLPELNFQTMPCDWAWALKLTGLKF